MKLRETFVAVWIVVFVGLSSATVWACIRQCAGEKSVVSPDNGPFRLLPECFEVVGRRIGTNIVISVRNRLPDPCTVLGTTSKGVFLPEFMCRYGEPIEWDNHGRPDIIDYEYLGNIPTDTNRVELGTEMDSSVSFSVPFRSGNKNLLQIEIDLHPQWYSNRLNDTAIRTAFHEETSVYFWELQQFETNDILHLHKKGWWINRWAEIGETQGGNSER